MIRRQEFIAGPSGVVAWPLVSDQLSKVHGRAGELHASHFADSRLHFVVGEACVDFGIQLIDNLGRSALGYVE